MRQAVRVLRGDAADEAGDLGLLCLGIVSWAVEARLVQASAAWPELDVPVEGFVA